LAWVARSRWFQNQITAGKLDDILLQPVPSLFLASLGRCSPLALSQVATGAIVLVIGVNDLDHAISGGDVLAWLALLANEAIVTWAARVVMASLAFWAPGLSQDVLFGVLWQFGRYPVSIYRQPIRFTLPLGCRLRWLPRCRPALSPVASSRPCSGPPSSLRLVRSAWSP
jgi:ABC-2 type transport system permease protein